MEITPIPRITQVSNVTVITLGPEYDNLYENMLADLETSILETAVTADPPMVLIEMPHTKFAGSAFLGLLLRISNRLNARNGRFGLCGLTPYMASIVKLSQMDHIWDVFDCRDTGIANFTAATE